MDRVTRHGVFNVGSASVRIGSAILALPLLVRLLGVEEFGVWAAILAAIAIAALPEAAFSSIAAVSVADALTRGDIRRVSETVSGTIGLAVGAGILGTTTLLVIAYEVVAVALPSIGGLHTAAATRALQIGALAVLPRLAVQLLVGLEQANERYTTSNILVALQAILLNGGLVVVAWLGGHSESLASWLVISNMVAVAAHGTAVARAYPGLSLTRHVRPSILVPLAKDSALMVLSTVGGTLFSQVDRLIVGAQLGTRTLGIYAAFTGLAVQINQLSGAMTQPIVPALSAQLARGEEHEFAGRNIRPALTGSAFVAFGLGGTLAILTPIVLAILVPGASSAAEKAAFTVLVAVYSLYSSNAVGYFSLIAMRRTIGLSIANLVGGATSLALIWLGSENLGLLGAALGNGGYVLTLSMTFWAMDRLGIEAKTWLSWIAPPVVWFAMALTASALLPDSTVARVAGALSLVTLLVVWLVSTRLLRPSLKREPAKGDEATRRLRG